MSNQNHPSATPLPSQQEVQNPHGKPRFESARGWLGSRTSRVLVPLMALLGGIALGIAGLFLLGGSSAGPLIVVPVNSTGDIIVEADRSFITQLVTRNMNNSGIPGHIQNVIVSLTQGSQMIVNGEDVLSILGIQAVRPLTFTVQLYVNSCFLEIHIVHADFSNLPVTSFAQSFENQINQQLQKKPEGLPSGFQYCTIGVRTERVGTFVTYSAIPD